jgi:CHAT domain-containing protein
LVEQGKKLYQARQFEEAATVWQQVADALAARGDKLNQAMALSNLSLTYQQLGKWDEAQRAIATSLNLLPTQSRTREQQRILASTLDIQGQLQLSVGQPEDALETWQQAADIYANIGNRDGALGSQINQAQAMQDLGFYPRACQTLLEALGLDSQRLLRRTTNGAYKVRNLVPHTAPPEPALTVGQDCQISAAELQLIPEHPSISLQILGLRSLGNVLLVKGQAEQSQMVLLKSWQLAQTREDSESLAAIALSLGNTARVLGNQNLAREQKQPSVDSIQSVTCIPPENHRTSTELFQQAIACYRQAELATSSIAKLQAQLNLLSLSLERSQWSQVPTLVDKIQSELTDLPSSRTAVSAQLKLAQSLICLQSQRISNQNQLVSPILQSCPLVQQTAKKVKSEELKQLEVPPWQAIEQLVKMALNQAQTLGDKQAEANALGYLGATYQLMGNSTKAQQLTEVALQRLSAFEHPELAYLWQWQLGRLYQLQGKSQEAIAAYTLAVDILESLRRDLVATNPDIQFNFRDSVEPVYRELVERLLQPSPNQQGQISQDNLKKARDIIESLQLAELNNFFQEACIDAQPQQIDQLDPQAAVIYSIVLPERLAVILSLPGKPLSYYETVFNPSSDSKASEEIERVFDDLFANLNPFISSVEPLRPQQQFYDWLIRPLAAELEESGIKTLVFVLDGVLRGVPMAALHDGQQYLIEKYNVALTPGLQLLSPRSLAPEQLRTLAAGLAEARQGFSPLPGVKEEVKEISEVVSAEVLLDQDFTRSRLQREIEATSFPVIHLATHGQFSSQVEDTFLLTWDERINVKNFDQLLREREGQERSPIELLILSACQTAAGDKRAVLGLAGIAVRSGARSTLATLWSVQDRSTAYLMSQFYEALSQPGISKAEALRQAQLSLLHSPQYQREHPILEKT